MHVLHVPFGYYPDSVGGTEVYVASLIQALRNEEIDGSVAAPAATDQSYEHNRIMVHRYAVGQPTLLEQYGSGDQRAASHFEHVLDSVKPDVVHLHAYTSGVSLLVAQAVKSRGLPFVLTYHTPTVSCTRGTMMLWGEEKCDGRLEHIRCTRCSAGAHGVPRSLTKVLPLVPDTIGRNVANRGKTGAAWLALQYGALVRARLASVKTLFDCADRIIVVCEWIGDVLRLNNVPMNKIVLNRHGLAFPSPSVLPRVEHQSIPSNCRFVYLGRVDETKGIDIIIRAFRQLPMMLNASLDIYGIVQPGSENYMRSLQAISEDDTRIRWQTPVASEYVVSLLSEYDALLVPSRWLETGPLVVLEAFAAGIPVIGSRLGGIKELVTDNKDGLLLPVDDVEEWQVGLALFIQDKELREKLRCGVKPPRSMVEVGYEMAALYRALE